MFSLHLSPFWRRSLTGALRVFIALVCLADLFLVSPAPAFAAPGDLVSGFGTGGIVTTNATALNEDIASMVILPDGKILAGGRSRSEDYKSGEFVLARYNSEGSLDTTFGANGFAKANFGIGWSALMDMAVQPDGRIVATGMFYDSNDASRRFAIARWCPDGTLDTGNNCPELLPKFGADGKVLTQIISGSTLSLSQAVVLQSDGKIVAGGYAMEPGGQRHIFALARYNPNGSLDASFDGDGKLTTGMGPTSDEIYDLALDENGKILAAGFSSDSDYNNYFAMARYNSDGSLDASFDGDGMVITTRWAASMAYAMAIQPADGKIILAGYGTTNLDDYATGFAVARYNTNGSLDAGFGTSGSATVFFDSSVRYDFGNALALDSAGRIVVGGYAYPDSSATFDTEKAALARFCPDGTLDTGGNCSPDGFSGDGKLVFPIGSGASNFKALAIRPSDGNILTAGRSGSITSQVFTMALFESGPAGGATISGSAGATGATLSYIDGTAKTVTADASGGYTIGVPSGWSGTVTPTKVGYAFDPPSRAYTNLTGSLTNQNYTATPITYTITGNAGTPGATLRYTDGTLKTVTADGSGNYTLTVSYNWSGTVTPSKTGFTFTPANREYSDVLASVSGQNFSAEVTQFTISGNAGVPGAILGYVNAYNRIAVADSSGNYSFTVPYDWSGTVTPSSTGYTFTPATMTYSNVTASQPGQDYQAVLNPPPIGQAIEIRHDRFTASWVVNVTGLSYQLDVATDPLFANYVPGYQARDAGNTNTYTVTGLSPNTSYYYRVRAYTAHDTSLPSGTAVVVTRRAVFLPVVNR